MRKLSFLFYLALSLSLPEILQHNNVEAHVKPCPICFYSILAVDPPIDFPGKIPQKQRK